MCEKHYGYTRTTHRRQCHRHAIRMRPHPAGSNHWRRFSCLTFIYLHAAYTYFPYTLRLLPLQNTVKLTFSEVKYKKISGGNTPEPPLQGEGRSQERGVKGRYFSPPIYMFGSSAAYGGYRISPRGVGGFLSFPSYLSNS